MRKLWWGVLGLMVLALLPVGASVYLYKNTRSSEAKTVMIAPKTGVRALLSQLHDEGLVPPLPLTLIPVMMTADYHALKAGEYEFAAGSTPAQVINKIIRGEVVVHKITLLEGWTSYQMRAALMNEPLLTGEVPPIAEGSLLPDTVHFARGEPRAKLVARMQQAQAELMEKLWPARAANLPYTTPEQALIMAAIVERETGEVNERPLVAGVFVNRLRKGMMLQTDPAVMYGIEVAQGGKPMDRALTIADLKADTPYNTYTRYGLTPTPICHPSRKAIEAALNPTTTDALYFVATGTGGHRFAATLAEHNANVVEYRKVMRAATTMPSSVTVAKPN